MPDSPINDVSFQRFKAEAEAIARVTHPNIVQVYALGEENGIHYMALEYVEGRNLREYLSKKGTTDTALALSITRQVASALQRASEIGIIHRDIKPENILLTKRGEVKVADFGLSRYLKPDQNEVNLTQTGMTMGTPLYMSPEQVQGLVLDARTDIYSLGITCYQMLAGRRSRERMPSNWRRSTFPASPAAGRDAARFASGTLLNGAQNDGQGAGAALSELHGAAPRRLQTA